jgi:ketosteroid isomerase-like protein
MEIRSGRRGADGSDSPREVFLRLVNGVCDGPYEDLAGLYAEQTLVTHPFHPLGPPPLRHRDELHEHFTAAPPVARTLKRKPVGITVHETADPEVIVAEFAYQGHVVETGEPFTVPCVFVMRIRDGLIVESRDYIDPIASARAWGQLDELLNALRPSGGPDQ